MLFWPTILWYLWNLTWDYSVSKAWQPHYKIILSSSPCDPQATKQNPCSLFKLAKCGPTLFSQMIFETRLIDLFITLLNLSVFHPLSTYWYKVIIATQSLLTFKLNWSVDANLRMGSTKRWIEQLKDHCNRPESLTLPPAWLDIATKAPSRI